MRRYFNGIAFGLIAAILLVVGGPLVAGHLQVPSVTDAATVKVLVGKGHGSGVHIGNGYIITAAHVVDEAKTVKIKARDGKPFDADVLWSNTDYDIALAQVADIGMLPSAVLLCGVPSVGDRIKAVGNPQGVEFISSFGTVAGVVESLLPKWKEAFIVDMTVLQGQSGGPVFGGEGSVVAIVVGVMGGSVDGMSAAPSGYGVAVPSAVVCKLMGRL